MAGRAERAGEDTIKYRGSVLLGAGGAQGGPIRGALILLECPQD